MKFTELCSLLFVALTSTTTTRVVAFAPMMPHHYSHHPRVVMQRLYNSPGTSSSSSSSTSINGVGGGVSASSSSAHHHTVADESAPIIASLKELLEHLGDNNNNESSSSSSSPSKDGGVKLWQASSQKWQQAIRQAVGAPDTASDIVVAHALYDAMVRPHNQFALLMGATEEPKFEAIFPSEAVLDNDNHTCWVEVQLRAVESDDLLVTMGVNLVKEEGGDWKIDELQWQDFRDAYYPGLSGREWLRAF